MEAGLIVSTDVIFRSHCESLNHLVRIFSQLVVLMQQRSEVRKRTRECADTYCEALPNGFSYLSFS